MARWMLERVIFFFGKVESDFIPIIPAFKVNHFEADPIIFFSIMVCSKSSFTLKCFLSQELGASHVDSPFFCPRLNS